MKVAVSRLNNWYVITVEFEDGKKYRRFLKSKGWVETDLKNFALMEKNMATDRFMIEFRTRYKLVTYDKDGNELMVKQGLKNGRLGKREMYKGMYTNSLYM